MQKNSGKVKIFEMMGVEIGYPIQKDVVDNVMRILEVFTMMGMSVEILNVILTGILV